MVGRRPDENTERAYHNKQLQEADLLELELFSEDHVMTRIGGTTADTNGPYTAKGDD